VTTVAPIYAETSSPVEISFGSPMHQRRLTVFFRIILAIPHAFVLSLVGIAAFVVLVIAWFAALFTGRVPDFAVQFLTGYMRWNTRLLAYMQLLTDKYPPFSLEPSAAFPVDLVVRTGPMNRWAVLFRFFLAIPGSIAAALVGTGMYVFSIITWVVTLFKGETPRTFFEANAAAIRYLTRLNAYVYLLTSYYPSAVLGDGGPSAAGAGSLSPPSTALLPPPPQSPLQSPLQSPAPPGPPPAWLPPPPTTATDSGLASTPPEDASTIPSLDWFSSPPTQSPGQAPPPVSPYSSPPDSSPPYSPPMPGSFTGPAPAPGPYWGAGAVSGDEDDPRWRLVLSSGARKLVVAFFFLGVLGYVGYFGLIIPTAVSSSNSTIQDFSAQNQTADAYAGIVSKVQTFVAAGKACTTPTAGATAQVQCLEANDAKLATDFDAYSRSLSAIDFPASVRAQASAARSAATQAAATMSHIAAAGGDPQAYEAAVTGSNIQSVLDGVDSSFNQLNAALIHAG
jgi:Domain of unknown function (DUF4389)